MSYWNLFLVLIDYLFGDFFEDGLNVLLDLFLSFELLDTGFFCLIYSMTFTLKFYEIVEYLYSLNTLFH